MSSSKFIKSAIATASLAIVLISTFSFLNDVDISLPLSQDGPRSSLTGLEGSDGPVLVVKIDDTKFAHPQQGLREADVVYIEQVEGGLTRLAAVYSSTIPKLIAPVRSARISDIELLAQYGKVAFAYSGAQRKMLPVIAAANLFDVGANKYGPEFFYNNPQRTAPYAMTVKAPELLLEASSRGAEPAIAKKMGWNFGDAPESLVEIESAHVSWPASSYDVTWSLTESRWLLQHSGLADIDQDGYQLGPATFVIQLVSITDSIYKDKVGGVTPFSATVGSGSCYILRDGGYIPCLWSRSTQESGTTFTDLTGKEVPFARGQIWFALTSREPEFLSPGVRDATKSSRK